MTNMFEYDKKKEEKDNFYDNLKNLHYKDSWLHNTVELAALGAIMVGAGRMAVKGDLSETIPGGKRAVGVALKGAEKYLKKGSNTAAKFWWQVLKRGGGNLAKMTPQPSRSHLIVPGSPMYAGIVDNIENSSSWKDRITDEVMKRIDEEDKRNYGNHIIHGDKYFGTPSDIRYKEIYEQVKNEELQKALGYSPTTNQPKKKNKWFGSDPNDTSPMVNTKNIGRDLVANGLAGLAFGAGISGFHALDRLSGDKDNQKKLEDTFSLAGSFLPKEEKNERMKKQAASAEGTKRLKEVGMKFPEAIAAGLGYTAVSLGASKVLGHRQNVGSGSGAGVIPPSAQNLDNHSSDKHDKNGPRVIIELPKLTNHQMKSFQGGLATLAANNGRDSNGSSKSIH